MFGEGRLDPGLQLLSKPYSSDALARKIGMPDTILAAHVRTLNTIDGVA